MVETAGQIQSVDRSLIRGDGWTLRLATAADAPALSELLRRIPFGGSTPIHEERGDTPFRLREAEAVNANAWPMHFLIEDQNGEAVGYLSSVTEQRLRRGTKMMVCHIGDIRLSQSVRSGQIFPSALAFALDISQQRTGAEVGYTVFLESDHQAMLALLKRESHRFEQPMAQVIQQADLIAVAPNRRLSNTSELRIERLTEPVLEETAEFISRQQASKMLGRAVSPEALLNAMRRWPATDMEAFFLARGSRGKLVGCALGWRTQELRTFVARSTPRSRLRTGPRPAGWNRLPKDSPITNLIQLTHLEVAEDNPGVLLGLVAAIRHELGQPQTPWVSFSLSRLSGLQSALKVMKPLIIPAHVTALTPAGSRWNNVDFRAEDLDAEHVFW